MQRLFHENWRFLKCPLETSYQEVMQIKDGWEKVELPHDWLIFDSEHLYESGEGWYQKEFKLQAVQNKSVRIYFDGVYMHSTVYVNDQEVGTWEYGYSSFEYDITDFIKEGKNTIVVQVRHQAPNSRWYSGAGIYRNVFLKISSKDYLITDGTYITTDANSGEVKVSTEIRLNEIHNTNGLKLKMKVAKIITGSRSGDGFREVSKEGKEEYTTQPIVSGPTQKEVVVELDSKDLEKRIVIRKSYTNGQEEQILVVAQTFTLPEFQCWSLLERNEYILETSLVKEEVVLDKKQDTFGFRTVRLDPQEGFFLNGTYMKLRGMCMHHDLGSLGSAMNIEALRRQLMILKRMGCNAIRTTHNMPSRELMQLCDELGFLVVSEAYDMWELPKCEFDNARFFKDTYPKDVASWVRRDRNHPCVIMWSIGNEIYDTHVGPHGLEIAKNLKAAVLEHDPEEHAVVTIGSNFIAWENAQKVADELKYSGYNYGERLYDEQHKKYPDWVIYGSETASTVKSRGIYHFPASAPMLMHEDQQCSSLDNSSVNWGSKNAEETLILDRDRKFCAGQFVWTGFDYIGEPTPYSTKNSYFGIVDTAGFPKDIYYMYQSHWVSSKAHPMVHILPYWDFNEGQTIDIIVYSNAYEVELFFNEISFGKQKIDHETGAKLHAQWKLEYHPGELKAIAYDESGVIIAEDVARSFTDPVRVSVKSNTDQFVADGHSLCFLEITTKDKDGNWVANARNRMNIEVTGQACLVGLDNGDSTDYDSYKGTSRRMFSGKLLAILQAKDTPGPITVTISSNGLQSATLDLVAKSMQNSSIEPVPATKTLDQELSHQRLESASAKEIQITRSPIYNPTYNPAEVPARKIELTVEGLTKDKDAYYQLGDKQDVCVVKAKILPENTTRKEFIWKVVSDHGTLTKNAEIETVDEHTVKLHALGDGLVRLRCMCTNGGDIPQVVSEVEFEITGLGAAQKDPYQFISACLSDVSNVPLNVIKDGAIGSFRTKTYFGYTNCDFGSIGTNEIILSLGNCTEDPVAVELWSAMPDQEGAQLLQVIDFPVNGRWDGFEPMKFLLEHRYQGVQPVVFAVTENIIFGGFEFVKESKAYHKLGICSYDQIYGDSFTEKEDTIEAIGNNVVLEFEDMDFGENGATEITICGRTSNPYNTIHIRFLSESGEAINQVIEFPQTKEYTECRFALQKVSAQQKVSFVFMPGSKFDFSWFEFKEDKE